MNHCIKWEYGPIGKYVKNCSMRGVVLENWQKLYLLLYMQDPKKHRLFQSLQENLTGMFQYPCRLLLMFVKLSHNKSK